MKELLVRGGLLCLLCFAACIAWADDGVTVTWDWQNDNPSGIKLTAIEGKTDYVTGSVGIDNYSGSDVKIYVDATNGKLNSAARYEQYATDAQFNSGTIIHVPVVSKSDVVKVVGNYAYSYTIGGTEVSSTNGDNATQTYNPCDSDIVNGFVVIEATGGDNYNSYLYSISVTFASESELSEIKEDIVTFKYVADENGDGNEGDGSGENSGAEITKEVALYTTDFTEWSEIDRKADYNTGASNTVSTKYSHEDLTFNFHGVGVYPTGTSSSFSYIGYMETAKYTSEVSTGEPYAETTALASITKIKLTQAATGGTRGIKVSVKGDGDTDWEVIHDKEIGTKSGEDLELEVNRTNCQIKFENYSGGLDNNAYVTDLAIYGSYTFTGPLLETVTVNGVDYDADDIFEEDNDGNMAGTVNISKTIENEDITVSATALNGTITNANNITVDVSDEGVRTATIEVTLDEETRKYILTIGDKPDYTLTYLDQNGDTLTETQLVEEDATIGEFKYSGDELTVADGYKFRGWFVSAIGGRKYTTDEVITEDITLYAIVTEIETESTTARYAYDLTDEYFYAEDHEAFNPSDDENVKWHDASHGWAISNGKSIDLLVGGNAYILLGLCNQTNSGTTITLTDTSNQTVYSGTAVGSSDGQILKIDYEGKADTLTLTASGGTVYLHSLVIGNIATASIETNDAGWYVVNVVEDEAQNGDELLKTLDIANLNASSESRTYIFLPNGTYDLGNTTLTKIYGENISLIGQSMDSTIIVNAAQKESIDQSATLLVTGDNCYIQDLTLENDYPYYTYDNGRAVCLWDQANHTICKNVRMLSYQDTYYSYNSTAEKYFETSDIHGTVDFICGNGVVFFKNCTITVEKRKADGTGECTITAPNTAANQDYGYVFYGCTIENKAAKYNLGRAWDKEPRSVFLYTTLKDTENLNSNRWNATGISTVPKLFAEYNSYNSEGTIINATTGSATNNVTFTGGGTTTTLNTILPESDAESYELNKVIDSSKWAPDKCATQLVMSTVSSNTSTETLADSGDEEEAQTTTLSWNAVDDALAYAIFKDGEFVEIINKSDNPSYEAPNDGKTYTVRVANQYGGFGDSSEGVTTLISNITDNGSIVKTVYYNLSGARVSSATKGVVIKVDTMENGKQVATKIVK